MDISSLAFGLLSGLSLFFTSPVSERVPKKLNLYTDSGLHAFYSLPSEIQGHIKSMFMSLIKSELKYLYFEDRLVKKGIFISNYCQKLDREESKIAYDEDHANDRYVESIFFTGESNSYFDKNHHYLCLKRSRIGMLSRLECKQQEVSLVTFKNNTIKAYYKRDNEGYDLQMSFLSIEQIRDNLDCLGLALAYNCFDSAKADSIPLHSLCRKVCYGIGES